MDTFPAFYPLSGRRVVIAGDGDAADAKARLFHGSPAVVVRLAPTQALDAAAYVGADLIFVASFDRDFVAAAVPVARASGAPLNVVDHPELSDFHTPAIIDRGQVVAAIGTAGAAPLLASLLRAEVETRVPASAGRIAALLGGRREALREAFPDLPARRAFLRAILAGDAADLAAVGDMVLAGRRLDEAIAAGWSAVGRVAFLASPAAPDLVSVRAVRWLNVADVVHFDAVDLPLIDAHGRRDAELRPLAAADGDSLNAQARAGRIVAVVGHRGAADLSATLAAAGVAIDRLAPAPPA